MEEDREPEMMPKRPQKKMECFGSSSLFCKRIILVMVSPPPPFFLLTKDGIESNWIVLTSKILAWLVFRTGTSVTLFTFSSSRASWAKGMAVRKGRSGKLTQFLLFAAAPWAWWVFCLQGLLLQAVFYCFCEHRRLLLKDEGGNRSISMSTLDPLCLGFNAMYGGSFVCF